MEDGTGEEYAYDDKKRRYDDNTQEDHTHSGLADWILAYKLETPQHDQKLPEKSQHGPDRTKKEAKSQGFPESPSEIHGPEKLLRREKNSLKGLVYAVPDAQFRQVFPRRDSSPYLTFFFNSLLFLGKIKAGFRNINLRPAFTLVTGCPSGPHRNLFRWYRF